MFQQNWKISLILIHYYDYIYKKNFLSILVTITNYYTFVSSCTPPLLTNILSIIATYFFYSQTEVLLNLLYVWLRFLTFYLKGPNMMQKNMQILKNRYVLNKY